LLWQNANPGSNKRLLTEILTHCEEDYISKYLGTAEPVLVVSTWSWSRITWVYSHN